MLLDRYGHVWASTCRLPSSLLRAPRRTVLALIWLGGFTPATLGLFIFITSGLSALFASVWTPPHLSMTVVLVLLACLISDYFEVNPNRSLSVSPSMLTYGLAMALVQPSLIFILGVFCLLIPNRTRISARIANGIMQAFLALGGALVIHMAQAHTGGISACRLGHQGLGVHGYQCETYLASTLGTLFIYTIANIAIVYSMRWIPRLVTSRPKLSQFLNSVPMIVFANVLSILFLFLWINLGPFVFLVLIILAVSISKILSKTSNAYHVEQDLKNLTDQLESEKLYRALANSLPDTTAILFTMDNYIQAVQGGGTFSDQVRPHQGKHIHELTMLSPEYLELFTKQLSNSDSSGLVDIFWEDQILELQVVVLEDHLVEEGSLAVLRNVTLQRYREEEMQYLASHDALTGLANRRTFDGALHTAHQEALTGRNYGLLMMDLDHFKSVNDSLGHETGDELLKTVAQRLTHAAPKGSLVARLAGDEFVVLCPDASEEMLSTIGPALIANLNQPTQIRGHYLTPEASMGAVNMASVGDASEALRRADAAMYYVKHEDSSTSFSIYRSKMTMSVRSGDRRSKNRR